MHTRSRGRELGIIDDGDNGSVDLANVSRELDTVLRLQRRILYRLTDLTHLVEQQQHLALAIEGLIKRIAALEAKITDG